MKRILSERNVVVVLFVLVFITFSLAHEDTKKREHLYQGMSTPETSFKPLIKPKAPQADNNIVAPVPSSYIE
jgi:hypothetical protein